jgi:hypothetical protein
MIHNRLSKAKYLSKKMVNGKWRYIYNQPKDKRESKSEEIIKREKEALSVYTSNGYKGMREYLNKNSNTQITENDKIELYRFSKLEEELNDKYKDLNFMQRKIEKNSNKEYKRLFDKKNEVILKQRINDISNYIFDNKISRDMELYRGIKGEGVEFFNSLKVGDFYKDVSFSSTSSDFTKTRMFSDGLTIKILAKKGSSVADIKNERESEYLIDRNSRFKVVDRKGSGLTVELL